MRGGGKKIRLVTQSWSASERTLQVTTRWLPLVDSPPPPPPFPLTEPNPNSNPKHLSPLIIICISSDCRRLDTEVDALAELPLPAEEEEEEEAASVAMAEEVRLGGGGG